MARTDIDRRSLMTATTLAGASLMPELAQAQAHVTAPLADIASAAKKVTIKSVMTFDVLVPQHAPGPPPRIGTATLGRINVTRVETDIGMSGYSFLGSSA